MPGEKIEPRLLAEIREAESSARPQRRLSVIIAHATGPADADRDRRLDYAELEARVRAEQQGLRRRLLELGVDGGAMRQITLAHALEASLTPAQILDVAERSDVRSIVWNREQQVTA